MVTNFVSLNNQMTMLKDQMEQDRNERIARQREENERRAAQQTATPKIANQESGIQQNPPTQATNVNTTYKTPIREAKKTRTRI